MSSQCLERLARNGGNDGADRARLPIPESAILMRVKVVICRDAEHVASVDAPVD